MQRDNKSAISLPGLSLNVLNSDGGATLNPGPENASQVSHVAGESQGLDQWGLILKGGWRPAACGL